nr:hypothetical protein [Methylogaea oryzae]
MIGVVAGVDEKVAGFTEHQLLAQQHGDQHAQMHRIQLGEAQPEKLLHADFQAADARPVKPEKQESGQAEEKVHGEVAFFVEREQYRIERLGFGVEDARRGAVVEQVLPMPHHDCEGAKASRGVQRVKPLRDGIS